MRYQHMFVLFEHDDGNVLNVSYEMLGEARRLMDGFNRRYALNEKVIAILLGHNVRELAYRAIDAGADAVILADHEELRYPRVNLYTKVICSIVRDRMLVKQAEPSTSDEYVKPRYMLFGADSIGRHISATVLAELESGLASDVNKLVIDDVMITHQYKTNGKPELYRQVLFMYRPDFSGFLWTQILCLDNKNPTIAREYSPQACSVIPGVFEPLQQHDGDARKRVEEGYARIVEYKPEFSNDDLKYRIVSRQIVRDEIGLEDSRVVVAFGRGIKDDPEGNIRMIEEFANLLGAKVAISLPLSKQPFNVSSTLKEKYFIPARVVGSSGKKVAPKLYIAIGISGAMHHLAGMKESDTVIAINPDPDAPIKDESDIFIQGRLEDVLPILIESIRGSEREVRG
ncbi:MAG: electron transfer flavoprotein subunit alpha/FixB family protein [Nitrososphaera sp.]|uniref:Electron transfer flavoprotein subunit alpha n=2 Tax=Candidatus Nitrosocaldus cavascurensis TaxID=2058097 RepID=A0A2K5AT00_9ARCH|nr:electron transfer flavoprotein subunit alpha/FixB family protein [Candidatus Nitrosocaldus islandicus]SPC34778.1 Electron transfer flavoprotein subunit alpha [Candidatus Nitrosocaldus cavascurensis]